MTIIVSPDNYLLDANGVYRWSPSRASQAWEQAYKEFAHHLRSAKSALLTVGIPASGKSTWAKAVDRQQVIFDATSTTLLGRRPLIEMAQEAGVPIEAAVFPITLIKAMRRNAERSEDRRIPYDVFTRMVRQLESEPPTLQEGFWRITAVTAVRPLQNF